MFKLKHTLFFVFLLILPVFGSAQAEKISAALNFLQKGNLDSARISIDDAVVNPATANDFQAWHIKGFVYKEIYKQKEKSNKRSPSRLISLDALKKSIELDVKKEVIADNLQGIKYLCSTLYNDAGASLDPVDYETAVINFEKYKLYFPVVDPSPDNLKQKELEFNLAIATVYTQIYRTKKDVKFFNLTKTSLNNVLSIDPNNISANYNMGLLYYNQAVDLILDSDSGIDLAALNEVQDNSVILFKQSLPFMEKVYVLNPKHKENLIGLSGIYFGLNEKEKSDEFKSLYENIEK